ncbi:hypothetical protein SAMN05216371_6453 [Streptomyces sp. TLI_053]|nr:hypothetical protein SAMN05216371_6453 [Streptomyces sp. TLI_053]
MNDRHTHRTATPAVRSLSGRFPQIRPHGRTPGQPGHQHTAALSGPTPKTARPPGQRTSRRWTRPARLLRTSRSRHVDPQLYSLLPTYAGLIPRTSLASTLTRTAPRAGGRGPHPPAVLRHRVRGSGSFRVQYILDHKGAGDLTAEVRSAAWSAALTEPRPGPGLPPPGRLRAGRTVSSKGIPCIPLRAWETRTGPAPVWRRTRPTVERQARVARTLPTESRTCSGSTADAWRGIMSLATSGRLAAQRLCSESRPIQGRGGDAGLPACLPSRFDAWHETAGVLPLAKN